MTSNVGATGKRKTKMQMHLVKLLSLVAQSPTAETKRPWPEWRHHTKLSERKKLGAVWSPFMWALYKNAIRRQVKTCAKQTPESSASKRPHDLSMMESHVPLFVQYSEAQDRDRTPLPRFPIIMARFDIWNTRAAFFHMTMTKPSLRLAVDML